MYPAVRIFVLGPLAMLASGVAAQSQIVMSVFTDPHPIVSGGAVGFTYAGNKFVGSALGDGAGILYATDLSGKNVRVFAPGVSVPAGSISSEHYVASSLGLGGFPERDIYVGAGNGILHISNDGTRSSMFVTDLATPVRAMHFDGVGTFGHDLLVTTYGGQVYRITSQGIVTLLASVGEDTEGLDIAPRDARFGAFSGQLIIASENSGLVRAISPSGKVSVLNANQPIPGAESLSFVPMDLGASGSPVEGLYEAEYTQNVVKADASQFLPFKGDALVTGEFDRQISRVHWNGTGFTITVIGTLFLQAEDGVFVTPTLVHPGSPCLADEGGDSDEGCAPPCRERRRSTFGSFGRSLRRWDRE